MAEPNLNGVTPIPDSLKNNTMGNEKMYQQFNGVHSSQSSRSSSPSVRFDQIPASQLPPSRSPLTAVTHQMGRMNMHPTVASIGSVPPQQNPAFPNMIPQGRTNIVTSDNTRSAVPTQIPPANFPHRPAQQQGTQNQPFGSYQMKTPAQVTPNMLGSKVNQLPQQMNTNGPTTVPPIRTVFPPNQNVNRNHFPPIGNPSQVTSAGQIPPNMNRSQMYPMQNQNIYQTSQIRVPGPQEQNFNTFPSPQPKIMPPNVAAPNFNAPSNFQNVPRNTRPAPPSYNSQQNPNPNTLSHPNMIPAQPLVPPTPPSNNFQQIPLSENSLSHPNMRPAQPLVPPTPPSNNFQQIPLPANSTNQKTNLQSNRYPSAVNANNPPPSVGQYNTPQQAYNNFQQPQMGLAPQNAHLNQNQQNQFQGGVTQLGFNKLWGTESYDLLQTPNILPSSKVEAPRIYLGQEALDQANCSPDIFRCTLTKIPENNSLLQKSRLPLGFLIHPFRDLSHLPVIQCNVIVRCKACRTYINPFVMFVDNKRWKCNLCYRINELPEEFQFDPVTKSYGDPSRRPEIKSSTLEYIAPAEYMLRPPQPAVYLYLLDVSRLAIESGYLQIVTTILLEELKNIPGDARTHVGFVAYDSALHFYSLPEGITQPQELTVLDTEEVFLPTPDNLLVNLKDRMDLVADLLRLLPSRFVNTFDTNSALGAALQAAFKMMGSTGGRVTIFQASLPNVGPGALAPREDPSQRGSTTEVAHLNPVNDFYKRLALECSGQQIAVDMFLVNSQYVDMATISGISRFSGGCLHHFPLLKPNKVALGESFSRCFRRYLTRKIGFEAVMRIRCTRGLSIHTFHGNFFVRSTDLLSLPNINPDAGFGMQVAIEESLSDVQTVCFQAALLYTSSKGERRIRVHTMCLPVASTLHDIINSADQQCIVGLLAKMAVDRSLQSSLSDAREAFINVAIDILSCYKITLNIGSPVSGLMAPNSLKLLPLYIAALLKHSAFRTGSIRVDDRVMAMVDMKTKPLYMLIQEIYPDLYPIHNLEDHEVILNCEEESVHMPPRLQLTARCLESRGAFLMDLGEHMMILVCSSVSPEFLVEALGIDTYNNIPEDMYELPVLENPRNLRLHQFINYLNDDKPICATLQVIRDNSNNRMAFFERLVEDRFENALSYHEFLQHLKTQVK